MSLVREIYVCVSKSAEFWRGVQSLCMYANPRNYGIQQFPARILFADEVTFNARGMINLRNDLVGTDAAPRTLIKSNLQRRHLLNV